MARCRLCSVHTRSSNDPGHAPGLPETLPNSPCPSGLSFPFCTTRFPLAFPLCPKNLLGSLILDSASTQRDASWRLAGFLGTGLDILFSHRRTLTGPALPFLLMGSISWHLLCATAKRRQMGSTSQRQGAGRWTSCRPQTDKQTYCVPAPGSSAPLCSLPVLPQPAKIPPRPRLGWRPTLGIQRRGRNWRSGHCRGRPFGLLTKLGSVFGRNGATVMPAEGTPSFL